MLSPSLLSFLFSLTFARSLSLAHRTASRDFSSFYLTDRTPEPPSLRCHPFVYLPPTRRPSRAPSEFLPRRSELAGNIVEAKTVSENAMTLREHKSTRVFSQTARHTSQIRNIIYWLLLYRQGYQSILRKESIRNLTLRGNARITRHPPIGRIVLPFSKILSVLRRTLFVAICPSIYILWQMFPFFFVRRTVR